MRPRTRRFGAGHELSRGQTRALQQFAQGGGRSTKKSSTRSSSSRGLPYENISSSIPFSQNDIIYCTSVVQDYADYIAQADVFQVGAHYGNLKKAAQNIDKSSPYFTPFIQQLWYWGTKKPNDPARYVNMRAYPNYNSPVPLEELANCIDSQLAFESAYFKHGSDALQYSSNQIYQANVSNTNVNTSANTNTNVNTSANVNTNTNGEQWYTKPGNVALIVSGAVVLGLVSFRLLR